MFHILVAGYDKAWRQKTRDLLESGHYTVALAANGEDAISRMEKPAYRPGNRPPLYARYGTGLGIHPTLRRFGSEPHLMLASQESPSDRKQAFRAGVDDFCPRRLMAKSFAPHPGAFAPRARGTWNINFAEERHARL